MTDQKPGLVPRPIVEAFCHQLGYNPEDVAEIRMFPHEILVTLKRRHPIARLQYDD